MKKLILLVLLAMFSTPLLFGMETQLVEAPIDLTALGQLGISKIQQVFFQGDYLFIVGPELHRHEFIAGRSLNPDETREHVTYRERVACIEIKTQELQYTALVEGRILGACCGSTFLILDRTKSIILFNPVTSESRTILNIPMSKLVREGRQYISAPGSVRKVGHGIKSLYCSKDKQIYLLNEQGTVYIYDIALTALTGSFQVPLAADEFISYSTWGLVQAMPTVALIVRNRANNSNRVLLLNVSLGDMIRYDDLKLIKFQGFTFTNDGNYLVFLDTADGIRLSQLIAVHIPTSKMVAKSMGHNKHIKTISAIGQDCIVIRDSNGSPESIMSIPEFKIEAVNPASISIPLYMESEVRWAPDGNCFVLFYNRAITPVRSRVFDPVSAVQATNEAPHSARALFGRPLPLPELAALANPLVEPDEPIAAIDRRRLYCTLHLVKPDSLFNGNPLYRNNGIVPRDTFLAAQKNIARAVRNREQTGAHLNRSLIEAFYEQDPVHLIRLMRKAAARLNEQEGVSRRRTHDQAFAE